MNLPDIKKVRKEKGLTQEDVAKSLNVNRKTVTGWENEYNTIPLQRLIDFANIYKTSLDYIYGLTTINNYKYLILDKKVVGKNLLKLRLKNKRSTNYISRKLKIKKRTYCDYENGKNLIRTIYITGLIQIYGTFSIDDLLK